VVLSAKPRLLIGPTLEQRAKVQDVFRGVWGLAGLVSPLPGGRIVKYLTWHWVFFITVPVGLGAAALLVFFFHEQVQRKPQKLGYAGAALLSAGVVTLLFGVQGVGRNLRPPRRWGGGERGAPGSGRQGADEGEDAASRVSPSCSAGRSTSRCSSA
jgi:MFS family permease